MKKKIGLAVAGALVALLPLAAAYAAITGSKHDLSSVGGAPIHSTATDQICVFCHTPHKAMSTQVLWNHTPTASASFSWGDTKTSGGTTLPTGLSTRSLRCLACHDGSIALGDVSNFGGAAANLAMTGTGVDTTTGKLTDAFYVIGASGNLSGNHPVGIPYPGQSGSYNSITTTVTSGAGTGYVAAATITGSSSTTVKLFADSGLTPGTAVGVECGSCHDVHNSVGVDKFLWKSNAGSALCLSCHQK